MKGLYILSDICCVILYRVVGYRTKVVRENLQKSFPEKTKEELLHIEKAYYKHLCDVFLETFKKLTISEEEIKKRFRIVNPELIEKHIQNKQSMLMYMGHCGNWEWGGMVFALSFDIPLYSLYKPIANKRFEEFTNTKIRTRGGLKLVPMQQALRHLIAHKNEPTATTFIADQASAPESSPWITFLNQDTTVFDGVEKLAEKFNYPVIYVSIKKTARGYYQMEFTELQAADTPITLQFFQVLERDIKLQPEIWLWSHRRWKFKRP